MSYDYSEVRAELFTEPGVEILTAVRRNVERLLPLAGAVRAQEAMRGVGGDTWCHLAALDYLVEKGEIREITTPGEVAGQHRIFVAVHESMRA